MSVKQNQTLFKENITTQSDIDMMW